MNVLKKHWRFIATLVVLGTLLVIGYNEVGAKGQAVGTVQKSVQGRMAAHYRLLFDDSKKYEGRPATSQGVTIAAQTVQVQEIEKRRNAQLRWETESQYTLASLPPEATVEDMVAYYQKKRQELLRDLSYQPNVTIATTDSNALGFTARAVDKMDRDQIADYLARLDMVRVVAASTQRVGIPSLRKLEFIDAKAKQDLSARGLPVQSAGKDANKADYPPYLKPRMLKISVRGAEEAIYNFLIDLQRPLKGDTRNRFFAVEGMSLSKPDVLSPSDDMLNAEITVVAYSINEEAPLPGSVKTSREDNQAGQPRKFR
ncbi:MAG: hypothetical protein IT462_02325 [Planctomycetes bacterium]|nr:hypothetical protein [Planctomycetota bacterium]